MPEIERLKADRERGALIVRSRHLEPDAPPDTIGELDAELEEMARWLGLSDVSAG